jgi:glycine cleavage system H protein
LDHDQEQAKMIPADLLYTSEHEWVKVEDGVAAIGITDHAQNQLGDIVFVDLPETGSQFTKGAEVIALESAKAAASIYAPATGKVTEVNEAISDDPSLVNSDCYGGGWMYKLELSDKNELESLMAAAKYENYLSELE